MVGHRSGVRSRTTSSQGADCWNGRIRFLGPASDGVQLGNEFVLVDEPAEDIASPDCSGLVDDGVWMWRSQSEAAVRPTLVVVPDVLGEDPFQVAPGDQEQVVEAVLSDGANPASANAFAFGERTGVRMVSITDRGEDLVEAAREFGISVADEEPHSPARCLEVGNQVAGDLGHPGAVRLAVTPRRWTARRSTSIRNST
jgi:hypothetical protein